jgi:hypothetical protein
MHFLTSYMLTFQRAFSVVDTRMCHGLMSPGITATTVSTGVQCLAIPKVVYSVYNKIGVHPW